jgi:flagellar FliJ protein
MPKFVFRLQGVLRQRKNAEQQRQRELAMVQAQMAALDAELRALDNSKQTTEQDLRNNRLMGRLDLAFLAAYRRYALSMQRKAMEIAQKMAAVAQQLDLAKKNLAEAAKKRKVLEKLRERQFERWREQLLRHELAELDEVAMQMSFQNIEEALIAEAQIADGRMVGDGSGVA